MRLKNPIPPLSVVRLASSEAKTPKWASQIGRVFRIGYYSRQDGLDCVWLVDDDGKYEQATDHEFLYRYFDIIYWSEETRWYGKGRPKIPSIRRADLKTRRKHKTNTKTLKRLPAGS